MSSTDNNTIQIRRTHRVIPSILLHQAIPELVQLEHQQQLAKTRTSYFDDDDEDGENNNHQLDYHFTTQFESAAKHTSELFNRVKKAGHVLNAFSSKPHSYVYGKTLQGKAKPTEKEERAASIERRQKNVLSKKNNSSKLNQDESSKNRRRSVSFGGGIWNDHSKNAENEDDDDNLEVDDLLDYSNENNGDGNGVPEEDDDVRRLLRDDWRVQRSNEEDESSQTQHQSGIERRTRLPNVLDVANEIARKNRRIHLVDVSRAMARQEDDKKARSMIHFDNGLLLSQRKKLMEKQIELQDFIEGEDGTNFILSGIATEHCMSLAGSPLKSKSKEILSEEYFHPSETSVLAVNGNNRKDSSKSRENGLHSSSNNFRHHQILQQQQNQQKQSEKKQQQQQNDNNNNYNTTAGNNDSEFCSRLLPAHQRTSASYILRNHKEAFLVEDAYRRIDQFISSEDDNSVAVALSAVQQEQHEKERAQEQRRAAEQEKMMMMSPLDFVNKTTHRNSSSSGNESSEETGTTSAGSPRSSLSQHSYQPRLKHNLKEESNFAKDVQQQQQTSQRATFTYVSQAAIAHAIQQTQLDEEHERHLILRQEQQFCRSIVEAYRHFHVLSVQPLLEAEKFSKNVHLDAQIAIDNLETKLRVGTHSHEEKHGTGEDSMKAFQSRLQQQQQQQQNTRRNSPVQQHQQEPHHQQKKDDDEKNLQFQQQQQQKSTFCISPAGYSILSSLGEQMDKLRAEIDAKRSCHQHQQQQQQQQQVQTSIRTSTTKTNDVDDENEHHQSIVFRAKKLMAANNKKRRQWISHHHDNHGVEDDDEAEKIKKGKSSNNAKKSENELELDRAASAMAEALQVAQNQQTALALSKVPQLCPFSKEIAEDTRKKYLEHVKQYSENQIKEQKEADELKRVYRHASTTSKFHNNNAVPNNNNNHHSNKSSNMNNNSTSQQQQQYENLSEEELDKLEEEEFLSCIRNAPPPTLVTSKRWAETSGLLLAQQTSFVAGIERKDFAGLPVSSLQTILSSSVEPLSEKRREVPVVSGCDLSTNQPCYDIFYPRFVAFEEGHDREQREKELAEMQKQVTDASVLARNARSSAAKCRRGVVQCILQQADLF